MSATTTGPAHAASWAYTVSASERILYGQCVDGVVRVTANPGDGHGHAYLVELVFGFVEFGCCTPTLLGQGGGECFDAPLDARLW
jgi:hypothetical protein